MHKIIDIYGRVLFDIKLNVILSKVDSVIVKYCIIRLKIIELNDIIHMLIIFWCLLS